MKKILMSLLVLLCLFGCSKTNTAEETIDPVKIEYDETDTNIDWDETDTHEVVLNETTITADTATVSGSKLTINKEGIYHLTGNLIGNIVVNTQGTVTLVLDNVSIKSNKDSAILVEEAEKVIITLADNSKNYIEDSNNYTSEEVNATIFSKDDLTLNGNGELYVTANYNDAIASKDGLKIMGGIYTIISADDGIRGKDYVLISNGTFNITSTGDGIKSTEEESQEKGYIVIENGTFNIVSTTDGIDSSNTISITGGTFNITSSSKGIKTINDLVIENANITIISTDDSIHSNDIIDIKSGSLNLTSQDDGIHADTTLTIEDGTINILKSYEGLESSNIYIKGGIIEVKATDDGINVAGGNDSSSMGRPGQNNFSSVSGNLNISGGTIYVDAAGDGLDSNGSITMSGGKVIVNGPINDGNGSLDYDGTFNMTGGYLIAAGSSGMLQTISNSSSINAISVVFSSYNQANTLINIKDSNGNNLVTFSPSKTYSAFLIASPSIKLNTKYTISYGGTVTGNSTYGIYEGTYSGGTSYGSITTSSVVTQLGNSNHMQGGRR